MNNKNGSILGSGKSKDGYDIVFLDNKSVGYVVGVEIKDEFFYWVFNDQIGFAYQMFDWLLNNNADSRRKEWKFKKYYLEKKDGNNIYWFFSGGDDFNG